MSRLSTAQSGIFYGSYGPTQMHIESFEIAKTLFNRIKPKIEDFVNVAIPNLQEQLVKAGAPPILD